MRQVLMTGMVGSAVGWFDYAVYALMAEVLSTQFFAKSSEMVNLIQTFGVFAVSFIARPLGGVLFNWIRQKFGVRLSLKCSSWAMIVASGMVAVLPTYSDIGFYAPALLILSRALLGMAIGAESGGSVVYMIEHASINNRGIVGSMGMFSILLGFFLGGGVAMASMVSLSEATLFAYGWRIPFLIAALMGGVGFYIRKNVESAPVTKKAHNEEDNSQLAPRRGFYYLFGIVMRSLGVYILVSMPIFIVTVFFITLNSVMFDMSFPMVMAINMVCVTSMLLAIPCSGYLSDVYGRKRTCVATAGALLVFSYPLIGYLPFVEPGVMCLLQAVFSALVGLYLAPIPALLAEMFPSNFRYTGMSTVYNVSAAVFGGTAPMVCVWLEATFGGLEYIAYYVMVAALLALCSMVGYHDKSWEDIL